MGTWFHFTLLSKNYHTISIVLILFFKMQSASQARASEMTLLNDRIYNSNPISLYFFTEPFYLCLGDTISISLYSTPFDSLTDMNLVFTYDTTRIHFLESENYVSAIPNFSPQVLESAPGRIVISYSGAERLVSYPVMIVNLSFATIKAGEALLQWEPLSSYMNHTDGAPFDLQLQDETVTIIPLPEIQIEGQTNYCEGENVELKISSNIIIANVNWILPFDTFIGGNLKIPNILLEQAGLVNVNISDIQGCKFDTVFQLAVFDCAFKPAVPNAFRPESEIAQNRIFKPIFGSILPSQYSMQIYNNWGQLLFETKDITTGWDGKLNGSPLNHGVFAWKITYSISPLGSGINDQTIIQGTVFLVR